MLILLDVAFVAFFLSLVLTPCVRRAGLWFDIVDRPDGGRKLHKSPVPRVGGVAVIAAYVLSLLFLLIAPYRNIDINIPAALSGAWALAPAAILVFLIGILDDIRGLKPWQKLAGQGVAAVLAYHGGFGIYIFRGYPLSDFISLPLTIVWLLACSNAINLIDGMDGLAAGVGFFASATTLVAALTQGNIELAIVTAPLAGSLVGFLRYNFNPASIFLGDSGSLLIGFLLGCYGALWSHKSATILGMTAPLIAMAIPLLDVCMAVARRFLQNRPIFSADRGHIHHRLLDQGLTPRRVALILYSLCGLSAVLSLLQDMAQQSNFSGLIVVLFCGAAWLGVQSLGYAEFDIAGRFLFEGGLRRTIAVELQLRQFEIDLKSSSEIQHIWDILRDCSDKAGFAGVVMRMNGQTMDASPNDTGHMQEIRVPISTAEYVSFYRKFDDTMHPCFLSGLPDVIHRVLSARCAWIGEPVTQSVSAG